jgi:asparagine synthase (glutamine-hydrolysing)
MCGIAGIIDSKSSDLDGDLARMLQRLVHRGPDGEGRHIDRERSVALGMRRLSIIDLEGGWQPIWNEDHTICAFFNGEIYNYLELGEELRRSGHRFRTRSDTEVLVHLYEEYGEQMTKFLRGMFAFCIFDRQSDSLFLARDHFGQKPLYFTRSGDRFAFASELKALLALPWVDRELDDDAFLDFVAWLSLPAPRTHFRSIRKLPAGCSMRVSLTAPKCEPQRYWRYELTARPDLTDIDSAIAELDRALSESVALHLRADVPLGILLSSGLDSRTVLAYAQAHQGGKAKSFSVGFGSDDSELIGAADTARELGSEHHQLELHADDLANSLEEVINLLDEPIGDPACFAVLRLCKFARGYVKVLLSGEGSDEILAGYEGRYAGMLATMGRSRKMRLLAPILPKSAVHASPSRWDRLSYRAQSSPASEVVQLRIEGLPGDIRTPRGLNSQQLGALQERIRSFGEKVFRPQRDELSSLLMLDLEWQLAESLLQKADKMSMGASIELRTPILDIEVARVASRIPSELKLPLGGPGKFVLRKLLATKLDEPIDRPKRGFPVPVRQWLKGPLRERIEGELLSANSFVGQQLENARLQAAWRDFLAGWDASRIFFALWAYEKWQGTLRIPTGAASVALPSTGNHPAVV